MDLSPFRASPPNQSQKLLLLCFAMRLVTAAPATVFAALQAVGRFLFVLLRIVVPALALGARHYDHYARFFLCHQPTTNMKKTDPGPVRPPMLAHARTARNRVGRLYCLVASGFGPGEKRRHLPGLLPKLRPARIELATLGLGVPCSIQFELRARTGLASFYAGLRSRTFGGIANAQTPRLGRRCFHFLGAPSLGRRLNSALSARDRGSGPAATL
jgi:hypothetical protein